MPSIDICIKCGRNRPSYIADPSCREGGYCEWQTPSKTPSLRQLNRIGELIAEKRALASELLKVKSELLKAKRALAEWQEKLEHALNTPELYDFGSGVVSEAQHQRTRWGSDHDAGKTPADWFWLVGYLAGKCLASHIAGDTDKALHHAIATAAATSNWHAAIANKSNQMRPGILPDNAIEHALGTCNESTCPRCIALINWAGKLGRW
jgi:hypothetical protein